MSTLCRNCAVGHACCVGNMGAILVTPCNYICVTLNGRAFNGSQPAAGVTPA